MEWLTQEGPRSPTWLFGHNFFCGMLHLHKYILNQFVNLNNTLFDPYEFCNFYDWCNTYVLNEDWIQIECNVQLHG